jgi:Xaa-Pro aminopeptidase
LTPLLREDFVPADSAEFAVYSATLDRGAGEQAPQVPDPVADHVDPAISARRADVDHNHERVAEFLTRHGYDALVLGRADFISWFTAGGDLSSTLGGDSAGLLLFINKHHRALLADNVQSSRAFEEEVAGLGFQLKERPWQEDLEKVVAELGHQRRIATDGQLSIGADEHPNLKRLRWSLSRFERLKLRELGRSLTLTVEAACRNFQPGETETDIAGHLAHRLWREGITPVELRITGDDRLARFRQPKTKPIPIQRRATITCTGKRFGLNASVTRSMSFGQVEPALREAHALAAMVDASCLYFSRPGEVVREVFRRARRIYEKFGHADEWMLGYQGFATGYHPMDQLLLPDDDWKLEPHMALRWMPSVGPARSEDTIIIDPKGFEIVTEAQNWPKLEIEVKGFNVQRPGILER